MQFYFIRHAQSSNNALWDNTGSDQGRSQDPGLTEVGQKQARRLAEFLCTGSPEGGLALERTTGEGFGLTHLYCSLMERSVATGVEIARALGLPLVAWSEVHEGGGIYLTDQASGEPVGLPGHNRAYFERFYPSLILPEELDENGWWGSRPYESFEARPLRARRVLAELHRRHGGSEDRVAVVSHGGFYNYLISGLLGLEARDGVWFTMNNAAITRVDFLENRTSFVYFNRMDYLPSELIT